MKRKSEPRVSFAPSVLEFHAESATARPSSPYPVRNSCSSRDSTALSLQRRAQSRLVQPGEMTPTCMFRKCRFFEYGLKASPGVVLCLQRSDTLQDVFEFLTAAGLHPSGCQPRAVFTIHGDPVRDAALLVHGFSYFLTSGRAPSRFNLVPSAVSRDFLEGVPFFSSCVVY